MFKKYKDIILLALSLFVIFLIYIYTTYPAFKNDDSPETSAVSYVLGIGHPPSYPLYTLAGKIFTLLPAGSPAFRMNLFAIFLGIVTLFLTFFVIRRAMRFVFGRSNRLLEYLSLFILAFSYIFWSQAIEAKGGIYVLNIFFLAVLIWCILSLLKTFSVKHLYLMAYIYGLSLSNHWPSMVILLPVFGYMFYKYRDNIKFKNIMYLCAFIVLGLSPYIYLPVRAGTEGVYSFMARPDNWKNFWWTVLRAGYGNATNPSPGLYYLQIKEFLTFFLQNYSYLFLFGFVGMFLVFKKSRELFFLLTAAFLIIISVVLLFNRPQVELIWVQDNFTMAAEYIFFIMIIMGLYFFIEMRQLSAYKNIILFLLAGYVAVIGALHFEKNNGRYNYVAYDFGNNIIKTLEPGAFYLVTGDYYGMPLVYMDVVEHKTSGIFYQSLNSLNYKWGIEDFSKKYGFENTAGQNLDSIVSSLLDHFGKDQALYYDGPPNSLKMGPGDYAGRIYGMLVRTTGIHGFFSTDVFRKYSYRGIYDLKNDYDIKLTAMYSSKLTEKGNECSDMKQYAEAIQAYKSALAIKPDKNEGIIYYNLSVACMGLNRIPEAVMYLKTTVEKEPTFWPASEQLGKIYLYNGILDEAKKMFELALKSGSPDRQMLVQYLNAINAKQRGL
jgi:tetratricopeptide (TPR) repeat protein